MCHKLSHMFHPIYISDKIVLKHISVKEKLDLEPKGQGQSKKQNRPNMQANKNITPLNKLSTDSLGNCVQLMSQTGYE